MTFFLTVLISFCTIFSFGFWIYVLMDLVIMKRKIIPALLWFSLPLAIFFGTLMQGYL